MKPWQIRTPHAFFWFAPSPMFLRLRDEVLRLIPGVREERNGSFRVPENAVPLVASALQRYPVTVTSTRWGMAPPPPLTWEEVEPLLAKEMKPEFLGNWPKPYQKEGVSRSWNRKGFHLWHATGAGKSWTGLASCLSERGLIIIVTRSASKIQFAREATRFTGLKVHILRTERQRVERVAVQGQTYWTFYRVKQSQGMPYAEIRAAWRALKEEHGLDKVQGLHEYLAECKAQGTRPIVVVAWELLRERGEELSKLYIGSILYDEAHRGRNHRRYDVTLLKDLPEDPEQAKAQIAAETAEAAKVNGFIKEDEEGARMLFTPTTSTAASAALLARSARKVVLTSVGPTTRVVVRGGPFGAGQELPVEAVFARLTHNRSVHLMGDYEYVAAIGVETRSWDEAQHSFRWASVAKVIRHPGANRRCVAVTARGVTTVFTDDHSVFVARAGARFEGKKRWGVLAEASAGDLRSGDLILLDGGNSWHEGAEQPVDVLAFLEQNPSRRMHVSLELTEPELDRLQPTYDQRRRYTAKGLHGAYLPWEVWYANKDWLPRPPRVHVGGRSAGVHAETTLWLSHYAYLLGLFLGNGWFSEDRIGYSLRPELEQQFLAEVEAMPHVLCSARVKARKPHCIEFSLANYVLCSILQQRFGKVKATTKYIPHEWIFTWPHAAREDLLRGILDSDGHVRKKLPTARTLVTASERLAQDYMLLLRSVGRAPALAEREPGQGGVVDGRRIVGGLAWAVSWQEANHPSRKRERPSRYRWGSGAFESKVRVIEPVSSPEWVYDIEVAEGHPSFAANGFLAHNTATPLANRVRDLWAQLDLSEPNAWGNASSWLKRYADAKPGQYGGMDTSGTSNKEELRQRLSPIIHVVPKSEAQKHVPPLRRVSYYISPEDLDKPSGGVRELEAAAKRGATAVLEVRLAQAASMKRKAVMAIVGEHLRDNLKLCILTARRRDVDELVKAVKREAPGVQYWGTSGDDSGDVRQGIVDEYMAHPGPCVLIGTGQSLGESLNLDKTDTALFVMLPYTPEAILQWEGRYHRNATQKSVTIYYVIAEGTVDERVASILLEKLPAVGDLASDSSAEGAMAALSGKIEGESEEDFAASILADIDGNDGDDDDD